MHFIEISVSIKTQCTTEGCQVVTLCSSGWVVRTEWCGHPAIDSTLIGVFVLDAEVIIEIFNTLKHWKTELGERVKCQGKKTWNIRKFLRGPTARRMMSFIEMFYLWLEGQIEDLPWGMSSFDFNRYGIHMASAWNLVWGDYHFFLLTNNISSHCFR